ncbi:hypothetical protein [Paenibacillus polymyxa]|uniref:hypothetical protein n=1 Tax=Paenibacillus polymyxa TaxID=1406 RepID=UPI000495D4D0|nr:hypothetical protein [Paenibacillus polymyxa]
MAKHPKEIENRVLTTVITFKRPDTEPTVSVGKCGCGADPDYEVYGQPHCKSCMLEAIDNKTFVMVKRWNGGFDDAS